MRDNSDGMIEMIDAYKEEENHYAVIEMKRNELAQRFRFGISLESYKSIKNII